MRVRDIPELFLEHFQRVVQHPLFFFLGVIAPLGWMGYEATQPDPLDSPKAFYPFTILIVTMFGYWIESAMKVSQAKQSEQQQEQLDRMEAVGKDVAKIVQRAEEHDEIMLGVLTSLEDTVKATSEIFEAVIQQNAHDPK